MNKMLSSKQHFYSSAELSKLGLSHYKINKLIDDGKLIRINGKIYENTSFDGDESEYENVTACIPKGKICMMTAARYYGLTTFLPDSIDIAIERSMKVSTIPDFYQIKLWYFPEKRYVTGETFGIDSSCKFPIYDIEKTVIDILNYRNKVGIESTKEVLKKYLNREERDLIKLHRYAEKLGCKKILETYLEVLL